MRSRAFKSRTVRPVGWMVSASGDSGRLASAGRWWIRQPCRLYQTRPKWTRRWRRRSQEGENEYRVADLDFVARCEDTLADRDAVHEGAVAALQILDFELSRIPADQAVAPRDGGIQQRDLVGGLPADGDFSFRQRYAVSLEGAMKVSNSAARSGIVRLSITDHPPSLGNNASPGAGWLFRAGKCDSPGLGCAQVIAEHLRPGPH